MARRNQHLLPYMWSVGALVIIGTIAVSIVLLVPRSRDADPRGEFVLPEPAVNTGEAPKASTPEQASTDTGRIPSPPPDQESEARDDHQHASAERPGDRPDSTSDGAASRAAAPSATPPGAEAVTPDDVAAEDPVAPAETESTGMDADAAVPPERRPPSESWRVHHLSARASVFLYDGRDTPDGVWYRPAPSGQRYVLIRATLSWDGADQKELALISSAVLQSRVWVTDEGRRFHPVGRLDVNRDGLQPLSLDPVECLPGEKVAPVFVFQVPSGVKRLTIEVDREPLGSFDLDAPFTSKPADLVGSWRRVPSQIHSLRYENPLANEMADSQCRSLRIVEDRSGLIRIHVPCAAAESEAMPDSLPKEVFETTLVSSKMRHTARLRVVQDEPPLLLLYVGEDEDAAFLFQRDPKQE